MRCGRLTGAIVALALAVLLADVAGATAQPGSRWGWLGVRIRDLSEQEIEEISKVHGLREGYGAMIVEVLPDTPAAAADIRSGDLVVAFQDAPVVDSRALQRSLARARIGERVRLTVLRRGSGRTALTVAIGQMPEPVMAERIAAEFGFLVRDPELRPAAGRAATPVAEPTVAVVLPRSRAERAGLRPGDVLVEVAGEPVLTGEAARRALLGVRPDGALPLVVRRDGDRLSLTLDPLPAP